jgi:hypothetical protein
MFFVLVASVGLKIVSCEETKRDHPLDRLVHLGRTTYGLKNTVKKRAIIIDHGRSSSRSSSSLYLTSLEIRTIYPDHYLQILTPAVNLVLQDGRT